MEIRPCTRADLRVLADRWPAPGRVHETHFEAQVSGRASYLVAWHEGEPVGSGMVQWCGCVGANARAAFPDAVEVNHLQVREGWRGRGVGSTLVREAEALARSRGVLQTALGVGDTNTGAERLYLQLGYRPTGVFDVCAYDWIADGGTVQHAVERDQLLVKVLQQNPSVTASKPISPRSER